jgi:cardiolipin synthase
MGERRRPLITANMVTLARLVPMPLLSWWIYLAGPNLGVEGADVTVLWWALILGTVIGCTDFVDGFLARKHGPTVLGGLLDPIADKVFIAFLYLPFAHIGWIPAWAVGLMFMRELLVTALRSTYERRSMTMKTSYFGKVKTWTQMQGIGVIVLYFLVSFATMRWLFIVGIAAPLVAMAGLWLVRRKLWRGALVMSGSFVALYAVHASASPRVMLYFMMVLIVGVTWASGFDYLFAGLRQLRGRGDLDRADIVRIAGSIALPVLIFAVAVETTAPGWALLTILALELAVGGLDNLVAHHKRSSGALPWGSRVLGASALLGAALLVPAYAVSLAVLAAAVSFAGATWEAWRARELYLNPRVRDEALRDPPTPAPTRP